MPPRLAILGIDPIQREWLEALEALASAGEITLAGAAHRTVALARDAADFFGKLDVPAFDDLRLFLKAASPQIILMDRPENVSIDFLVSCMDQGIGVISLGPPVENLAEAQALSESLEPKTQLLYIWPRFTDSAGYQRCTQADEFVRPIKFAAATWMGMNHALAKFASPAQSPGFESLRPAAPELTVRSLSVLAWDALATLIDLINLPTSVYAAIRGTVGSADTFADISGAASLTLRFPDDAAASLTLCDRMPPPGRRELLLVGQGGTVKLGATTYDFRDMEGKLIDASAAESSAPSTSGSSAMGVLREYLRHFAMPSSPHRGWTHRLTEVSATMEALIVSHRTGQGESPERFLKLRR